MEAKFKSLLFFEFKSRFPDNDSCYAYLRFADLLIISLRTEINVILFLF